MDCTRYEAPALGSTLGRGMALTASHRRRFGRADRQDGRERCKK